MRTLVTSRRQIFEHVFESSRRIIHRKGRNYLTRYLFFYPFATMTKFARVSDEQVETLN